MYDSIQAIGPLKVSFGSKIHKMRNIAFGIIQMHFFGVLICIMQKALKNMFKISRFQRFFWFLGQNLAKNHHFTAQIYTKCETLFLLYPKIYPYFLKTAYFKNF